MTTDQVLLAGEQPLTDAVRSELIRLGIGVVHPPRPLQLDLATRATAHSCGLLIAAGPGPAAILNQIAIEQARPAIYVRLGTGNCLQIMGLRPRGHLLARRLGTSACLSCRGTESRGWQTVGDQKQVAAIVLSWLELVPAPIGAAVKPDPHCPVCSVTADCPPSLQKWEAASVVLLR